MKFCRLVLIALLSLTLPAFGLAGVAAATPCCPMHSEQQHIGAMDGQDHCAEMSHAPKSNVGETHHSCKAGGKCGCCNHAPCAATHSSMRLLPAAYPAAISLAVILPISRSPDGLWRPPRAV